MKRRKLTPEEIAYAEASLERLRDRERKIGAELEARRRAGRSDARRRRLFRRA